MSESTLPPIESVSGGSHGVRAGYEQMLALADTYETRAADFKEMAGLGARVLADGDLLESAVLSPISFAEAELQVLEATTGVDGLTVRALGIEADALGVRAVVAAFRASDEVSQHTIEMIDNAFGTVLGLAAPLALPALLLAGGVGLASVASFAPDEHQRLLRGLQRRLGQTLHDHPEVAQHLLNAGGGLLEGLGLPIGPLDLSDGPINGATTNDAARLLALLLGNDTEAVVSRLDGIETSPEHRDPPRSLSGLMAALAVTNNLDREDPGRHGAIQIQGVVGADGQERFIVYLPGTDDMAPLPGDGGHARDMETNYQLIGGLDTAYGDGIAEAMRQAGLAGREVTLVGHSQGGMVATSLAADAGFAEEFDVRHVVTAGSPTAQVPDLPPGTSAIHFENRGDAVPLLDGEDNPDQPHRTTVLFDEGDHRTAANHGLDRYTEGARAADASSHGSIRSQIDRMREDGFLGAGAVSDVQTFTITRG